LLNGD
jgi:hypothetical protein